MSTWILTFKSYHDDDSPDVMAHWLFPPSEDVLIEALVEADTIDAGLLLYYKSLSCEDGLYSIIELQPAV
jgi:hypothetical protein